MSNEAISSPPDAPAPWWRMLWVRVKYIVQHKLVQFLTGVFTVLCMAAVLKSYIQLAPPTSNMWNNQLAPFVGVATLIVAVVVWWNEVTEECTRTLPKRVTVRFWHQGKELMRCEKAHLFDEADMRSLGQQIGAQMTGGRHLQMVAPAVRKTSTPDTLIDHHGNHYLHYEINFTLLKAPENIFTTVWKEPFLNEDYSLPWDEKKPPIIADSCFSINLNRLFSSIGGDQPILWDQYLEKIQSQLANRKDEQPVKLTGKAPLWLYLKTSIALRGKVNQVIYDANDSDHEVIIFRQDQQPSTNKTKEGIMPTIDLSTLYADTGTAKLAQLPQYEAEVIRLAGEGNHITLTGPAPVWLYLRVAHALHGKAKTLTYDSPASGPVLVFDHDPS